MSLILETSFTQFTMAFKYTGSGRPAGKKEAWTMPPGIDSLTGKTRGLLLSKLRSMFLPSDITILSCIGKNSARPNKTYECLEAGPLTGKYGDISGLSVVGNGNVALHNMTVSNGTAVNPPLEADASDELLIEHPEIATFFRLESDQDERATRWLQFVPSIAMADGRGQDIPSAMAWLTSGTPTDVSPIDPLYWNNFVPFWNFLKTYMVFVRKNPSFDPAATSGDTSKPYALSNLRSVVYKKVDDAPVGEPIDVEHGRRF